MALDQRHLTSGVEAVIRQPLDEILLLGSGSRSPICCKIIAEAIGRPIKLVRERESTALGTGIHAAAAVGLHADRRAAGDAMTGIETAYGPDDESHARHWEVFEACLALYPNLRSTLQLNAETMR